jgi:membrane protein DedA with SNARE-associated domain
LASFLLNIIPFAGPSNLLVASTFAVSPVNVDPLTIGFLVALGSASAKFIHYLVTFFVRKFISAERRKRLDAAGLKLKKWAGLALFVVAATPLPDEPVIVPLGLVRYSPAKFYVAYFLGKLVITVPGAYLGWLARGIFASAVSQAALMIISIALTILVTVVLLRVGVEKTAEKVLRRKVTSGEQVEGDS